MAAAVSDALRAPGRFGFFMKAPRREPGENAGRLSNGAGDVSDGSHILSLLAHGGFYAPGGIDSVAACAAAGLADGS